MPDITYNHPAVEALGSEGFDHEGGTMHAWRCEHPDRYPGYCTCPEEAVAIVRDNLTADDLRDTPAGRALMAEGWNALIESMSASGEFHDVDLRTMQRLNPYLEDDE